MKTKQLLPLLALVAGLAFNAASAHEHDQPSTKPAVPSEASAKEGSLVEPTAKDAAWLTRARADYPLKTCLVSGEELGGSMGEAVERIYRVAGQPDRLIRFYCKDCLTDFGKEPAKYLKLLDAATGAKTAPTDKHSH